MIYHCLKQIADHTNDYLVSFYDSLEQLVEVNSIRLNSTNELPNKIVITLLNLERETGIGKSSGYRNGISNDLIKSAVPWYFNLNFMMAAVFDEKRHIESLEKLSTAIEFLQMNSYFKIKNMTFTVEPVSLSLQELNNIWSMMGSHHYPAFFGKLRMIQFDGQQIKQVVSRVSNPRRKVEGQEKSF